MVLRGWQDLQKTRKNSQTIPIKRRSGMKGCDSTHPEFPPLFCWLEQREEKSQCWRKTAFFENPAQSFDLSRSQTWDKQLQLPSEPASIKLSQVLSQQLVPPYKPFFFFTQSKNITTSTKHRTASGTAPAKAGDILFEIGLLWNLLFVFFPPQYRDTYKGPCVQGQRREAEFLQIRHHSENQTVLRNSLKQRGAVCGKHLSLIMNF